MRALDIMTPRPACCHPDDSVRDAAHLMEDNDCGLVPVVDEGRHLVGVVTDRDIAIRGIAHGRGADTPVRLLMTSDVGCCTPDGDIEEVERIMTARQVRRVPVVDDDGRLVGIIAQADLAREAGHAVSESEVARVVEQISEPGPNERWDHHDDRLMRM